MPDPHLFSNDDTPAPRARRGRAARSNATGRFERYARHIEEEPWPEDPRPDPATTVIEERPRSILTRNSSPDIGFDRSINPYRGCEHGCIYCYARPTHAWLGFSAGLDFETRLVARPDAPALLDATLRRAGYSPAPIAIGTNTDPYQPVERQRGIMRGILEVLLAHRHPVTVTTKGAAILRDTDILGEMGRQGLAQVAVSLTSLDNALSRSMEPRAAAPGTRLRMIAALARAGCPTGVMLAPLIPALNDHEVERLAEAAATAGASFATHIALRLPLEVKDLFKEWLADAYPQRAARVMRYVREMHGGREYDARWRKRMTGDGVYARLMARRAEAAFARAGLAREGPTLRCDRFAPPPRPGDQLRLAL
ncbi:MAG: PA0069 family radical SAM protein [Pseudomonadota bacterium]